MRGVRQAAAALRNGLRLVRTENSAQEPGAIRFVAVGAGRSGSAAGRRGARAETDPSSHRSRRLMPVPGSGASLRRGQDKLALAQQPLQVRRDPAVVISLQIDGPREDLAKGLDELTFDVVEAGLLLRKEGNR